MLALGVILLLLGVAIVLAGLFTADVSATGQVEVLGIDASVTTLFVLGVIGGAAILAGLGVGKFGAKRELAQRREQRRLGQLSQKLDRADEQRRKDLDENDGDRPNFF